GGNSDAVFFSALKGLLAGAANHKISTLDLQRAFEQVMPASLGYEGKKSLAWFFDSWVNGDSIPQFSLEGVHMTPSAGKLNVTGPVLQAQAAGDCVPAFRISAVDGADKSPFRAFLFPDDARTKFTLTAPAGTKEILLDPEETLLRR